MRDTLQPPDPGCLSYAEASRLQDAIDKRIADIAATDLQIGAERFYDWLDAFHSVADLVPLISAISRGDTWLAIQATEKLRGEYTEYLAAEERVTGLVRAEIEGGGHA
mgnify:CR=1 FL=1